MQKSDTIPRGRDDTFPLGASVTVEELDADPHPLLAQLRESEPVSWVPALGGWCVTRRDLALQVVRDPVTFTVDDPRFSTAQVVGRSMLSTDGDEHERHRGPFARPFRLDAVRARFETFVEREVERLLDPIEPEGRAELRRSVAGPLAAGANRDPSSFPDPDRFDVRRPNSQLHLAFAQGPHVCLGMHLARIETHAAVRGVLGRLPGLRLDPEQPSVVRGLVFRKPQTLHVVWG
jgi:cytochrome P450